MTVRRLCVTTTDVSNLANLGRGGCKINNPFKALKGVIFTTSDFSFDDAEDAAVKANWVAGIKAGQVFPMPNLNTYEDNSLEPTYNESDTQRRTFTRSGEYRFTYSWNVPFDVHKKLQSFRNAALRAFLIDEDSNLMGTVESGKIKGLSIAMINPLKMSFVDASAGTPSLSKVEVDYNDEREWNVYGSFIPMSWSPLALEPLTDVTLEVVGTPTSSSVVVRVYSSSGLASDGTISKVAVVGILQSDFAVSLTGAATSMTDNNDGTYTFASSAAFATGTIDLVPPASMVSEFGDYLIISTGSATVTIAS